MGKTDHIRNPLPGLEVLECFFELKEGELYSVKTGLPYMSNNVKVYGQSYSKRRVVHFMATKKPLNHRTYLVNGSTEGKQTIPILKDLLNMAYASDRPLAKLAEKVGYEKSMLLDIHCRGRIPGIRTIMDFGQYFGYRLVWEKIDDTAKNKDAA